MSVLCPLRPACAATLALLVSLSAHAQWSANGVPSRITAVKLYPGSARIERTARVPAGSRSVTFHCLPAALDALSLQVRADAPVRVGDVAVQVRERLLEGECASTLDTRVQAVQKKLLAAQVETEALELAQSYLQTVAGKVPVASVPANGQSATRPTPANGIAAAAPINATAQALRQSARDTLTLLHQARHTQEALERQLNALVAERDLNANPRENVASVTVTLVAENAADVRLDYQINGPSWSPSYRATLDTTTATVHMERLALISQHTGEDWSDVPLLLSTGQPSRQTQARLPRPWTVDVQLPEPLVVKQYSRSASAAVMATAPDNDSLQVAAPQALPAPASFAVNMAEAAYTTEFTVPQRITVPSGGRRVTLSLNTQAVPVQLLVRTTPMLEPAAYLVAQLPEPSGLWPAGPVALYRDGAAVGQAQLQWTKADMKRTGLSFGRDDRVSVTTEPVGEYTVSKGLMGGDTQRQLVRVWQVENRHAQAVTLQVLDAAPVSLNEQITVESQYQPAPQETAWGDQPGHIVWQHTLQAGAVQRFSATHTLRHAKELRVRERK